MMKFVDIDRGENSRTEEKITEVLTAMTKARKRVQGGNSLATPWLLSYFHFITYLSIKKGAGTTSLQGYFQVSAAADEGE